MKKAYQNLLNKSALSDDRAQLQAVNALALLSKMLLNEQSSEMTQQNRFSSIRLFRQHKKEGVKGLYFYGRVGRGKTMLMDLFYKNVEIPKKKRIHFHRFMEDVHQQLNILSQKKQQYDNPLTYVAKYWAEKVQLLCFDEFFVNDIGDAMLLSGLFKALFAEGVTLVATSNCKPEQLYKNGLQRDRFLPTIELIKKNCKVMSIDGETDYRLRQVSTKSDYKNYYLLAENDNEQLLKRFRELTCIDIISNGYLNVNNRTIKYISIHLDVIWFDFKDLCSGPRSQRDYIQLSNQFTTIFISNVPKFSGKLIPAVFSGVEDSYQRSGVLMGKLRSLDDEARRFIALVDEFYDRKIQLVISSEVDISQLYQGEQLTFEFARCQSRLFEMQT